MMWMRNKKAQNIVEYAMLFAITVAALTGMSLYLRNSVAGKWRQTADGFGHGRLYTLSEEIEDPEEEGMITIYVEIYNVAGGGVWSGNLTMIDDASDCYSGYPSIYCWIAWANMGAVVQGTCDKWCNYWGLCLPAGTAAGNYNVKWKYLTSGTWHYFQIGLLTGC